MADIKNKEQVFLQLTGLSEAVAWGAEREGDEESATLARAITVAVKAVKDPELRARLNRALDAVEAPSTEDIDSLLKGIL